MSAASYNADPVIQLAGSDRCVGGHHKCLIVAEIGQNHQCDMDVAKLLIKECQRSGAEVVKFQKTSLPDKFTAQVLASEYCGPNSWGSTYGAHKARLEFSELQHRELQRYATELGVLYTASAMDPVSAQLLSSMRVPFVKLGSGDADNLPLIDALARQDTPLFISTGMQDESMVQRVYDTVTRRGCPLALLHCTSAYPTPDDQVHLTVLSRYRQLFPRAVVGYSGHELGVAVSVAAVALGAKIVERHVTLNHEWRGSDHACSLLPAELLQLVTQSRRVEVALGSCRKQLQPAELPCRRKLAKSVVAGRCLPAGHRLSSCDLLVKVAQLPDGTGWSPADLEQLSDRQLASQLLPDQPLSEHVLVPRHTAD